MERDAVEFPPDPPPRRSRRRRYVLAAGASLLVAGAVAAGASALTGSGDEPAQRPVASDRRPHVSYTADGVPLVRAGPECKAGAGGGHAKKRRSAATVKY